MVRLKQRKSKTLPTLTKEIIEAAIAGFETQKQKIDDQIAELRAILTGSPAASPKPGHGGKRKFSPEALERMREAQKLRWAKVHGKSDTAATAAPTKKKRRLSAAGRKAISEAAKKRWATKKTGGTK